MEIKDLQKRFTYHKTSDAQNDMMDEIRIMALNLAILINDMAPESREKSLAITNLEESIMWANASIARNE